MNRRNYGNSLFYSLSGDIGLGFQLTKSIYSKYSFASEYYFYNYNDKDYKQLMFSVPFELGYNLSNKWKFFIYGNILNYNTLSSEKEPAYYLVNGSSVRIGAGVNFYW